MTRQPLLDEINEPHLLAAILAGNEVPYSQSMTNGVSATSV